MSGTGTPRRFTEEVRQELSRLPLGADEPVRVELAALLRLAGSITLRGGDPDEENRFGIELISVSGAVTRRAHQLLGRCGAPPAQLLVRAPDGLEARHRYGLRLGAGSRRLAERLGLIDAAGRPIDGLRTGQGPEALAACARGAVLAAGSISAPGREPHLEIVTGSSATAAALAEVLGGLVEAHVGVIDGERPRVVVKSGAAIGDLLAAVGATQAFLAYDEQRLRRQLRREATRLANADAANLRRTIDAAGGQTRAVQAAIDAVGWDGLDDDLRATALVRLANPEASLAELGSLLDPPVGKSAVHRRLARLERLGGTSSPERVQPDAVSDTDP